jgi:hypothetical protein
MLLLPSVPALPEADATLGKRAVAAAAAELIAPALKKSLLVLISTPSIVRSGLDDIHERNLAKHGRLSDIKVSLDLKKPRQAWITKHDRLARLAARERSFAVLIGSMWTNVDSTMYCNVQYIST